MDRGRSRVLALLLLYLGLVGAALFALDWFVASTPFGNMTIDMRSAQVCSTDGACVSFSLSDMRGTGFYAPLAGISFWGTILFSLLVMFQAFKRLTSSYASESLSKLGYFAAMVLIATSGAAAFLFGPEPTSVEREMLSLEVSRTSGPFLLLLGLIAGLGVLFYAVNQGTQDDVGTYKPLGQLPGRSPTAPPVAIVVQPQARPRTSDPTPVLGTDQQDSGPSSIVPDHLRKKLKYTALSAEVTRGGIDARREDGSSLLVMWRDVVGLVARRTPAELDGITFVDVVSVAGSTMRLLPWTRISGETVTGDGEVWSRALLAVLIGHCPEASLDPATKRFAGGEPAAQLPDLGKLAAHDAKLA